MNITFVKDVVERALKTFVYTFLASLSPNFFQGGSVQLSVAAALGIAASATVLSVLGSLASFGFGTVGTASLVKVQGGVQDWVSKEVLSVLQRQQLAVVTPAAPAVAANVAAAVADPPAAVVAPPAPAKAAAPRKAAPRKASGTK